jgi:rod shape determining protein RodA
VLARIWQGRLGGLRLIMLLAVFGLVGIGLLSLRGIEGKSHLWFPLQLRWLVISVSVFLLLNLVPYSHLGRVSYALFGITLGMLILIMISRYLYPMSFIPLRKGAHRWIDLEWVQIQPSELGKLTYIFALAWYLRLRKNYRNLTGLIGPFALTLLPMLLILWEPDLGTVLLFLPLLFSMLFVAGARIGHLLTIIGIGLLVSPVFYFSINDYQQDRIQGLVNQDPADTEWVQGLGYHLHRSKIYIATGELTGYSEEPVPEEGVVTRIPNLPEEHNDFIFARIAHTWGFAGALLVILLYTLLIIGGIEIAASQVEPFGRLLAVGISTLFATQVFINIGMTMGLMPVTGLNLPFVSYGGTSLLCNFIALGILVNVARYRPYQIGPRPFEFRDDY